MAPGARRAGGDESAAGSLTGGGPSQLGVGGSMRARDVSRPSTDDLAAAEDLVQVSFRPRFRPRPTSTGPQPAGSGGSSPDAS
jgi:hypothetical protein